MIKIPFTGKLNIRATVNKKVDTLVNRLLNADKPLSGYEVITGACVPYYDFDPKYDTKMEQEDHFLRDINRAMAAVKTVFPKGRQYVFTACGENSKGHWKNSIHIIVRGVGYAACGASIPLADGCDPQAYSGLGKRQLFRLPYFSKEGEDRPLVLWEDEEHLTLSDALNYHDYVDWCCTNIDGEELVFNEVRITTDKATVATTEVQPYLDMIENKQPDMVAGKTFVKSTENAGSIFMNYTDVCKTKCSLCDVIHDDNRLYGFLTKDKKLFLKCTKNDGSVFIHDFAIASDTAERKTTRAERIAEIPRNTAAFDLAQFKPHVFNEEFCDNHQALKDSIDAGNDVCVVANMGTGKTVLAKMHAARSNNENMGAISFRTSLAKAYKKAFEGFECYEDVEGPIEAKRWVCQLDSLWRIKNDKLDTLYIDEVSQVRRHLGSKSFMKNQFIRNSAIFKKMVEDCTQLIVMDANVMPRDLAWLSDIRGGAIQLFVNEAVPCKRDVVIVPEPVLIRKIADRLAKGERVFVAHNGGVAKHEPLKRLLEKGGHSVLVINAETSKENEACIKAIADPNAEFGKFDCIIASPSLQSGVSYDTRDTFDAVFGIFGNCTNSSGDACQMLNRIRHPKQPEIVVSIKEVYRNSPRSVEALKGIIKELRRHLRMVPDEFVPEYAPFNEFSEADFISAKLTDSIARSEIEESDDRARFECNFVRWNKRYGNTVRCLDEKEDKEADKMTKAELKAHKETVKDENAKKMNDAVNLSFAEAEKLRQALKDHKNVKPEQILSLKKFNLNNWYKKTNIDDPAWYKTYDNPKLREVYGNSAPYFRGVSMDRALDELKASEIRWDRKQRTGDAINGSVSLDQCIVSHFLRNPRWAKEKVIVGFLMHMGFDRLDSAAEVDEGIIRMRLKTLVDKLDIATFNALEKHQSKLKVLKTLSAKLEGAQFIKVALQFVNGSLKAYFGASIKRKDRRSKMYVLVNKAIADKQFATVDDGNTPVLGAVAEDNDDWEIVNDEPTLTTEERFAVLKKQLDE
jgi:hypothetical protein